jgi:hypothetical protein
MSDFDALGIAVTIMSAAAYLGFGPLSSIVEQLRAIRRAIEERE